jgi:UDP-GlcNAc:undecaprenyl-phosphate GlcNAc-1-phosphate transferase
MGDSGSLFLGFTLSSLAIARIPQASNLLAIMGVPTMLFLLPILDTSLVTITRLLRGQSPAHGGKDHASHRLIAFGLSERQAVLILYLVALISGILGIVIESINYTISLIFIPILLITLALLTSYLGRLQVVPPGAEIKEPRRSFTHFIVNLTYRGRILEVSLDLLLISISYYLSYWIHFGSNVDILNEDMFLNSLPIAVVGSYLSFFVFGLYRGVWQYYDSRDIVRYLRAAFGAVFIIAGVMAIIYYPLGISYRVFVIFVLLLIIGLIITRSSFTILDRFSTNQLREQIKEIPVLIYTANEAGVMLHQWLLQSSDQQMKIIGFLDDDPYKTGREILGVPVFGKPDEIESILRSNEIEGILLTSEHLIHGERLERFLSKCSDMGVWVKTLRLEFDLLE